METKNTETAEGETAKLESMSDVDKQNSIDGESLAKIGGEQQTLENVDENEENEERKTSLNSERNETRKSISSQVDTKQNSLDREICKISKTTV
jgi:hypothetical protein